MPLTPFHLGPALLLGLLLRRYLDFPTFLIANVIIDVEPLLVLTFDLGAYYRVHGFFHSFLGGTLIGLFLVPFMMRMRTSFSPLLSFFKIETTTSFMHILKASLSGVYLHILLDSLTHRDIRPFYPFDANPFLNRIDIAGFDVYILCMWCFLGALVIYGVRLVQK